MSRNEISKIMNELILKHTMNTVKKGQDNFKLKRYDTFCSILVSLHCFVKLCGGWGLQTGRWDRNLTSKRSSVKFKY